MAIWETLQCHTCHDLVEVEEEWCFDSSCCIYCCTEHDHAPSCTCPCCTDQLGHKVHHS